MYNRILHSLLKENLNETPATVILGPRQVGKTTLAHALVDDIDSVYLDLEDPVDMAKLSDPGFYFGQQAGRLVILDEIQRRPELFQTLRSQIDKNRRAGYKTGQFLLLGSASNHLLNQSSESLAGRVSYLELFPLNLLEVGSDHLNDLWLRGGFPDAFQVKKSSFRWRQNFIKTYLERDIPALGSRIPAETLRRFWTMLAHHQGQLFNASQIGGSLGVSGQAAARYLDLMVDLMLVRRLQPWTANTGKRLIKSPKAYLRDSGILHSLLNLSQMDDLLGHPVTGGSWEGFVIENLLSVAPETASPYFFRSRAGAEIDLILDFGGEQWAIEIKRSQAPKLSKGFYSACQDLKPTKKFLVYAGNETYQLPGEVTVCPLLHLMQVLKKLA